MEEAKVLSSGMNMGAAVKMYVKPEDKVKSIRYLYHSTVRKLLKRKDLAAENKILMLRDLADEMNEVYRESRSTHGETKEDQLVLAVYGEKYFSAVSILDDHAEEIDVSEYKDALLNLAVIELGSCYGNGKGVTAEDYLAFISTLRSIAEFSGGDIMAEFKEKLKDADEILIYFAKEGIFPSVGKTDVLFLKEHADEFVKRIIYFEKEMYS